jgi:hypothetical protein
MRDPARIQRILNKLAAAWQHSPDMRLGELVTCVADPLIDMGDVFNVKDDAFEHELDKWMTIYNITVSGGWKS